MPAKSSTLRNGPRHNFVDRAFWMRFRITTGIDISQKDFMRIINRSNELIKDKITENNSGFKLPEGMGYNVVTQYKPKAGVRSVDFKRTKELGYTVFHTNFHSFGYRPRIMWLTERLSSCRYVSIYKFVPERTFTRAVSKRVFEGKVYDEVNYSQFKSRRINLKLDKLK